MTSDAGNQDRGEGAGAGRRGATRLLLAAAAGLLVASCCLTRWHFAARHAVKTENVGRIARGMSRSEAEELLGRPADHYIPVRRSLARGETMEAEGESFAGPAEVRMTVADWRTASGPYVRVVFDAEGRVLSKRVEADRGAGALRRVRGWLLGF